MPIERKEIQEIVRKYESIGCSLVHITSIGSHSELDIARGALDEGFRALAICKKGREKTYDKYYKFRKRGDDFVGCINETIILDDWKDIVSKEILGMLLVHNSIFIPHRSAEVYLGYNILENELKIPFFGNRMLLRAEERTGPYKVKKDQDYLVKEANIPTPKKFSSPEKIDRPVIIKATKALGERHFMRQFPIVKSREEYFEKLEEFESRGENEEEKEILRKNFREAPIEEYVPGEKINLNFFYSPIHNELELLGCDTRIQFPNGEEMGHIPVSLRESLLEKAFAIGEKFVEITKKEYPPGVIGPFALQTVGDPKENLLVYDVSLRIPGSPDTESTPYTGYLFGESISFGRKIAREIKYAINNKRLEEIVT